MQQNRFAGVAEYYNQIAPVLSNREYRKFTQQVAVDPEDEVVRNAQRLADIKSALTGQNVDAFRTPSQRTAVAAGPRYAGAFATQLAGESQYASGR